MSKRNGRNLTLSPFRRLVVDLMHFSSTIPAVTVERRMNLARLVDARRACNPRPTWTALFAKACALVACKIPELRQAYMPFPWPHLYEHYKSIATFTVERQVGAEMVVVLAHVSGPENRSLSGLDAIIRDYRDKPIEQVGSFQRDMIVGRLPWPLRRLVWWATLNLFGRRRCHNFGTFGMTSVSGHGAGILFAIPLLTSLFHYGLLGEDGGLDMRLTFDHRVLDGAAAARVLVALEDVLAQEILEEVLSLRLARAA